jgi:tight adherence protein B
MGAAPVGILLSDGLGGMLLVAGTVLACAGLLWTDRIADRVSA